MTLEDKVLPQNFVVDDGLAVAIRTRCKGSKLSCGQAHALARETDTLPLLIGQTADALDIHLSHCQLGLFGYPGHKKGWPTQGFDAPEALKAMITSAADEGPLTCSAVWKIAATMRISKMQVAYVADQMGLRLWQCQLGAF